MSRASVAGIALPPADANFFISVLCSICEVLEKEQSFREDVMLL